MLRYIEGLQLQDEAKMKSNHRRHTKKGGAGNDDEPDVHDGLTVDYAKFT